MSTYRPGDVVYVTHPSPHEQGKTVFGSETWEDRHPTTGTVVFASKRFITVAFPAKYGGILYRESFWLDCVQKKRPPMP